MKKFTLLLATMLLVCVTSLWADVATLTFTKACSGQGTDDKGNAWVITSDAKESAYDQTKGIHYGTSSKEVSYLQATNGTISGTITQIIVNASGASKTSAKLDVTVGGAAFGESKSITNTATTYPFQGSASGEIVVKLSQSSAKNALYIKSIIVTYATSSLSSIVIGGEPTKTEYIVGEKFNTDGLTVTASYSDGTKKEVTDETEWTIEPETLNLGTTSVNVTASFGGQEATKTYDISVREPNQYTITWMTMQGESTTTAIEGQPIAAPADPTYAGKVFMGWSQNNTVAADGADFTAVDFTATTATANATYYAVFATKSVGGEPVYKKITSNDELTDGKYLLVATVSNLESYAAGTKGEKKYSSAVAVTVTDNTIQTKPETAAEFTIVKIDDTQFAMNDGENWLTSTANKADITYTGVEQAAPTDAYWKLTADGYVQSTNTTSNRYFGYNTQAPRFAAYANTSGQQIGAQLYKYSQSITTSDYVVAAYIEVEPAAIDFGELKDNENMSEKAEMVIALGHNLSEGITATLPEDAQFTIVSEPDGEGSLMVTVTPKPVIGTNEATLTFTSGICTATVALKAVIVKGTATSIEDAAASAVFSKMIENGQLVIVREGVKYNAMGVRLQ